MIKLQKPRSTVLGLDPGSKYTGYAVIKVKNNLYQCTAYGRFKVKGNNAAQRLFYIYSHIQSLIVEYRPHEVAVEEVFFYKNAKSSLRLTESRSAGILAATSLSIPVFEYSSKYIKKTSLGSGSVEKGFIRRIMASRMHFWEIPSEDAADAIAVALCHVLERKPLLT